MNQRVCLKLTNGDKALVHGTNFGGNSPKTSESYLWVTTNINFLIFVTGQIDLSPRFIIRIFLKLASPNCGDPRLIQGSFLIVSLVRCLHYNFSEPHFHYQIALEPLKLSKSFSGSKSID